MSAFRMVVVASAAIFLLWARSRLVGDEPAGDVRADRDALAPFQQFVGEWRGVGQPRRGSAKDAWSEECQWAWSFQGGTAALSWVSPNGKYVRNATLRAVAGQGHSEQAHDRYELAVRDASGAVVPFRGAPNDQGHLVLDSSQGPEGFPSRLTLRVVAGGDRLLVLYERRTETDRFTRLAEVGMTRKGSGFGQGGSYVECVVTGGVGTIAVTHAGETYYVCCTGCRDYFNDNPAEVLADYRARKAAEKSKPAP